MAEAAPLTPEEQAKRDELNAKEEAYRRSLQEADRLEKVESFKTTKALFDILSTEEIDKAFSDVIFDPKLDFSVKARLKSMRDTMQFNMNEIGQLITAAETPPIQAVTPAN
jgi:hypothetical protein